MKTTLNADLHCHSVISDGTLTPEALARRAKANGVELWSLTDHDEISGQPRALAAAHAVGVDYLTGVEISVTFLGETVHIVGLGFDVNDAALRQGLEHTRGGRGRRAQLMAAMLNDAGIPGCFEGALQNAGNPDLISRTHFARFMVETGVCQSTGDVFRRYLTPGYPGYVEHQWAALQDALQWITHAGGVAVVSHPARYGFSADDERTLFAEFIAHGGTGIEVMTGSHSSAECATYAKLAAQLGLAASRGSDFHSPDESDVDLGRLPSLPSSLTPVWSLLQDRILRA